MQKWLLPLMMSCAGLSFVHAADDMSLEGIVILGQQKSAVISNNGKQITVKIGDSLGEWTVDDIEARKVQLRPTADAKGARRELKLNTHINPAANPDAKPTDKPADNMTAAPPSNPFAAAAAANAAAAKNATPAPPTGQPPAQSFQPKVIEDKDIPAGHRRVRTPFGDVLVKDPPPTGQ
ncbi:MAG: hypothetical protein RIT27_371 [Pseudomonadota bacterium]|jgi:hypothetical protein